MAAETDEFYERRNTLLKDIDYTTVRQAWFTTAHLLLNEHAKVAHMGCGDGEMTFVMAVLNPDMRFIGIDKNKRHINKAKELYEEKVHNLEFVYGDVTAPNFQEKSFDAIINSYILHKVYSNSKYNPLIVSSTLNNHFKLLKIGGTMYIRDYARPPPEEYVLMEMPDLPPAGDTPSTMTETDLLEWYSEHARPKYDAGCGGFYLEELPPRIPKTRLYRLPYKWAYEFIMRKDEREKWERDLPIEYTFFTMREFRKELQNAGARVQYSAPYWDEDIIQDKFDGHFRLFDNDGNPLGHPPTCYIAVSQKMADRQSLHLVERRAGQAEETGLKISAMRNENTGEIVDIVSRDKTYSEVLPYTVEDGNRLKIYLHEGIVRPVANSVPRNGVHIDDKRWSGHTIEPVSVEAGRVFELGDEPDLKATVKFARDVLGMQPKPEARLVHGPDYYPAPDFIDERLRTYFLDVKPNKKPISPKNLPEDTGRFQSKGVIREFDAQQVLNAIAVGLIPNARLELQILALFEHLNLRAENWTTKNFDVQSTEIKHKTDILLLLQHIKDENDRQRFKQIRGNAGQLRIINSTFVEEGQAKGSPAGLAAQELDFVISDEKTINTAVVIPISKSQREDLHAGFVLETLPVPQRHQGNATVARAPQFNVPPEIKTMKQMKRFIADQMNVLPEMVVRLGESYFNHIGVTPQKIYPFAIVAPFSAFDPAETNFIPMHQFRLLWSAISQDTHFMVAIARAWKFFGDDIKKDHQLRVKEIVKERFEGKRPDWSIPMNYIAPPGKKSAAPARVLGAEIEKAPVQNKKQSTPSPAVPSTLESGVLIPVPEKAEKMESNKPAPFHQKTMEKKEPQGSGVNKAESAQKILDAQKLHAQVKAAQSGPLSDEFAELEKIAQAIEEKIDLDNRPEKW